MKIASSNLPIQKLATGLVLSLIIVVGQACVHDTTDSSPGFDRKAFLTNYHHNYIVPAFTALSTKADALADQSTAFTANPTASNLENARTAWSEAFLAWQYCTPFSFGPAELPLYGSISQSLGTYPVAAASIEGDIASGNFTANNYYKDRRGFLAAEYLLFGPKPDSVLAQFQQFNSGFRKEYLALLTSDIRQQVLLAKQAWIAAEADFVSNDGTDAGSSTSELFNGFESDFESIKNFELGLPLGLRPGQTQAEPTRVEAYFSGQSARFLKEHVRAIGLVWQGNSLGDAEGIGFDDYLQTVVGGPDLIQSSNAQWAKVEAATAALPATPLSQQITSDPAAATALHTELQKQTRFFKSDLSSLLGIAITFQSGDGD